MPGSVSPVPQLRFLKVRQLLAHGFGVVLRIDAEDGWRRRGARSEGQPGVPCGCGGRKAVLRGDFPADDALPAVRAFRNDDDEPGPITACLPNAAEPS